MNEQAGKRLSRGFLITLGGIAIFLFVFGCLVMRVRSEAKERWAEVEAAIEVAEIGHWGTIRTFDRGAPLPSAGFSTYQHRFRNWVVEVYDLGEPGSGQPSPLAGRGSMTINGEEASFRVTASVRMKLEQRRMWLFTETRAEIGVRAGELDGRLVDEAKLAFAQIGLEAVVVDEREAR